MIYSVFLCTYAYVCYDTIFVTSHDYFIPYFLYFSVQILFLLLCHFLFYFVFIYFFLHLCILSLITTKSLCSYTANTTTSCVHKHKKKKTHLHQSHLAHYFIDVQATKKKTSTLKTTTKRLLTIVLLMYYIIGVHITKKKTPTLATTNPTTVLSHRRTHHQEKDAHTSYCFTQSSLTLLQHWGTLTQEKDAHTNLLLQRLRVLFFFPVKKVTQRLNYHHTTKHPK